MVSRIDVRMYEVGFGDCFLLQFHTDGGVKRVLVDCGSITEGKAVVGKVVQDVVETCTDAQGVCRIDLVVATHRHKDHVGGFADPAWNEVEVGEVWMPWTEDPDDERATYIRNRQSALAAALAGPADDDTAPLEDEPPPREASAAATLRALRAMAVNALTNERAMATLHRGFARPAQRLFLPTAAAPFEVRTVEGLPGVRIHVLGPPRDEALMAVMDPPKGAGYLAAAADADAASPRIQALSPHWRLDEAAYRRQVGEITVRESDLDDVRERAEEPSGALAAALDNALNNTSLILMFEVMGHWLLFPADAQWGAWKQILDDPEARALLARTTFLKVGHHGSHNATPRDLIETLAPQGLTALFSTCSVSQWPEIPRKPLLEAIGRKGVYARSDKDGDARAPFTVQPGFCIEWSAP